MSREASPELPRGAAPAPTRGPLTTRRRLLDVLLGGSLLSWCAVVVLPILRYLKRPAEASAGNELSLGEDDARKIGQNGFAIVRFGTDRVIIFLDAEKKLRALEAKCTHEGCTVTYKADEALVWCACHNGKFAVDGRVISGPPPRPLYRYVVRGDLDSKVSIGRSGA
jgi:cytochrome b6-f complex iron-sulfur subunit